MAEKNNAFCAICGKPYHICISCNNMMSITPWRLHVDTINHYKIYQTLLDYNNGIYTKKEAKERLERIDLSDLEELRDNIKKSIKNILKVEQDIVKVKTVKNNKFKK